MKNRDLRKLIVHSGLKYWEVECAEKASLLPLEHLHVRVSPVHICSQFGVFIKSKRVYGILAFCLAHRVHIP